RRRQLRAIELVRAQAHVRAQARVERMVRVIAEPCQPQLDDRVEIVERGRPHHELARHAIPPPKRSWFGRRLGSGVARPYCPPSEREIFLRATSASSTTSHAATDVAWASSGARPTWGPSSLNPSTTSN